MSAGIKSGGESSRIARAPKRHHRVQVPSIAAASVRSTDRGETSSRSSGPVGTKGGWSTTGRAEV